MVGTRKATVYGRQAAEEIASDLARNKITIVSGLARGIDSIAHRSALQAGGRTIAVFGCGLDVVYPAENASLAESIIENGALISEFPLSAEPRRENFPLRNPWIYRRCIWRRFICKGYGVYASAFIWTIFLYCRTCILINWNSPQPMSVLAKLDCMP